jgi:GxxExxY protein
MEKIVECVKKVSGTLGNYYKENVYQSALSVELNLAGILFQTEVVMPIIYKGVGIGYERADIVVYSKDEKPEFIIELKSQNTKLGQKEINQLRKYISNLKCDHGILVNFYDSIEIIDVTDKSHTKMD